MMLAFLAAAVADLTGTSQVHLSNMLDVFSTDDYPLDALRASQHGITTAFVMVDEQGAPTACKIAKSSRVSSLDTVTCTLIMARARFDPARDKNDQAIAGSTTIRVKWVIPKDDRLPVADSYSRATFDLGSDGSLSNCVVEFNGKPASTELCQAPRSIAQQIVLSQRKHFAMQD